MGIGEDQPGIAEPAEEPGHPDEAAGHGPQRRGVLRGVPAHRIRPISRLGHPAEQDTQPRAAVEQNLAGRAGRSRWSPWVPSWIGLSWLSR